MVRSNVQTRTLVGNGLLIGLVGGVAEVGVVGFYTILTGGDAAAVGQGIATAVGLGGASAGVGLAVHMGLAAVLGLCLQTAFRTMRERVRPVGFMLGCLTAVWAVNFFVVLPILSPGFVHLLPYTVSLTSKLAFGLAAAAMVVAQTSTGRLLDRPPQPNSCSWTPGQGPGKVFRLVMLGNRSLPSNRCA